MRVYVAAEAEQDLRDIALRIAADDRAAAARFVSKLRLACEGLAEFPDRFPLVPRYERFGIRHRVVDKYLIFYQVQDHRVRVLHIRHGAADYSELLDTTR